MRNLTTHIPQAARTVSTSVFPALGYAETIVFNAEGEGVAVARCTPTQDVAEAMHAECVRQTRAGVAS